MMTLQQCLFADAGDFVEHLHSKRSGSSVFLAQNRYDWGANKSYWQQQRLSVENAIKKAVQWQEIDAEDCYATANGYGWGAEPSRSVSEVTRITGFYVDFDRYKIPQYKDLSPQEFLDLVLQENPWLPVPTIYVDTGNGCWMFWLFKRPLIIPNARWDWLSTWQTQQGFLVRKLSKYGADPKCIDAARVVRLPGTVNSKTLRKAVAWTSNKRYEFNEIKRQFSEQYRLENPRKALIPEVPKTSKKTWVQRDGVSQVFNWHSLAYARMQDMKRLGEIRGGHSDHRRMAVWLYSVEAAHFCRSEETLRSEVSRFAMEYIQDPEHYLEAVNYEETVKRFNAEQSLVDCGLSRKSAKEQLGFFRSKYTPTTRYIVSVLEITDQEQEQMRTLIGHGEKTRRRVKKRRDAGMMCRVDYRQRAADRRQEAGRLRAAGLSIRAIAAQMGMSPGAIHRYLA